MVRPPGPQQRVPIAQRPPRPPRQQRPQGQPNQHNGQGGPAPAQGNGHRGPQQKPARVPGWRHRGSQGRPAPAQANNHGGGRPAPAPAPARSQGQGWRHTAGSHNGHTQGGWRHTTGNHNGYTPAQGGGSRGQQEVVPVHGNSQGVLMPVLKDVPVLDPRGQQQASQLPNTLLRVMNGENIGSHQIPGILPFGDTSKLMNQIVTQTVGSQTQGNQVQTVGSQTEGGRPRQVASQTETAETQTVGTQTPRMFQARDLLVSSLAQAMATGATFGFIKPLVEGAIEQAIVSLNIDMPEEDKALLAKFVSTALGGAAVGLFHQAVGSSISQTIKGMLGGSAYKPIRQGAGAEAAEVAAVDVPVNIAFIATYAGGAALRTAYLPSPLANNIWVQKAFNSAQSTAGGALQGVITELMQAVMKDSYERTDSAPVERSFKGGVKSMAQRFIKSFSDMYNNNGDMRAAMKHQVGKIVGGTVGMVAAVAATNYMASVGADDSMVTDDLSQGGYGNGTMVDNPSSAGYGSSELAAVGMTTFLAGWFTMIHTGAMVGNYFHDKLSGMNKPREPDVESGNGGQDNPGFEGDDEPEVQVTRL